MFVLNSLAARWKRGCETMAYPQGPAPALPERHAAGGRLATIPGVVPGSNDRPAGCLFAPRCAYATPRCEERPVLRQWRDGRVRCHYPLGEPAREEAIARDRAGAVITS